MREWENQSHAKWYCRYHVVIVPKYRHKAIFGTPRGEIGKVLKEVCRQQGIDLVEGHAMPDHVHMCLSVPPKFTFQLHKFRLESRFEPVIQGINRLTRPVSGLHLQ